MMQQMLSRRLEAKKKTKLSVISPSYLEQGFERRIINLAMNRSYTKQMASGESLDIEETLHSVARFVLSFIPSSNISKELEEYWCIVLLNEDALELNEGGIKLCSACENFPNNNGPKTQRLYQLFIGLAGKEIRLTSLQDYSKIFIVNLDTVEATMHQGIDRSIKIVVDGRYELNIAVTPSTLPFGVISQISHKEVDKLCNTIASQMAGRIRKGIAQSKGKKYSIRASLLPDPEFYYKRYATEQQFSLYCQPGDVILFKDNHNFAKIQRFLTHSQCDHIGVVFKYAQKNDIWIFESNSGTGVSLVKWSQLVRQGWYKNIEGIYWRRLALQSRPPEFDENIRKFVERNLHKAFGFHIKKLFSRKEIVYEDPAEEKNRTYFCSQLVASLYRELGLLNLKKPSSTYIPKDFTDRGSLDMINNSALQCERRIIFNESVLSENYGKTY